MGKKKFFVYAFLFTFFVFPRAMTEKRPLKSSIPVSVSSATDYNALEARSECVMEVNSRRVLYEKQSDIRLPMASTTKIVTALTVLGAHSKLSEEISFPTEAVGVEGSSIYAKQDEKYTVEELLYGLMLRSGNDAATALALQFGGTIENFACKMNETAQKCGALSSNFKNPHGLPQNGHYTTAKDLSRITCYAMENETFREIVATKYYKPRNWQNKNKLLSLYDGGIGVKTGYTKEAGRCLVSAAKRNDMTLVCTLLNCPTTYERTMQLFDACFADYHNETVLSKDDILSVKIGGKTYKARADRNYVYPMRKEEQEYLEINTSPSVHLRKRPNKGKIIGQFEIYLLKRLIFSGNLYKL